MLTDLSRAELNSAELSGAELTSADLKSPVALINTVIGHMRNGIVSSHEVSRWVFLLLLQWRRLLRQTPKGRKNLKTKQIPLRCLKQQRERTIKVLTFLPRESQTFIAG